MASHATSTQFFVDSQKLVECFLQTVVMIDDRAYEPTAAPTPSAPPRSPVRPLFNVSREQGPEREVATESRSQEYDLDDEAIEQASDQDAAQIAQDVAHVLDPQRVVDQFSNKGIICAVLKPTEGGTEPFEKKARALSAADVLILDWVWFKDVEGKRVSEVIARIIKESSEQHRMRLILIYTGQRQLERITDALSKNLMSHGVTDISSLDDFTIQSAGTRITVYSKGNVEPTSEALRERASPFDELPNTVITEFTKMTAGLVPNIAVASLSEIRRATHRLLARFSAKLDAPFLAHRALLKPPSEGNEQIVPLIVSELEAILEDQLSENLLSDVAIANWLATQSDPLAMFGPSSKIKTEEIARATVRHLVIKGVAGYAELPVPNDPNWAKKLANDTDAKPIPTLTNLIAGGAVDGSNEELELLMSLRPRYRDTPPMLTLGTLLRSGDLEERTDRVTYWVCLQPACDSFIRSGEPRRSFPLLELSASSTQFNLLAKEDREIIYLRWEPKPYKMRMIEFEANSPSGAVNAVGKDGRFWFAPTIKSMRFRWLGELKFPQAQRIAQALANAEARVGLTETEWLRRNAT
jgi:hypothetical protein